MTPLLDIDRLKTHFFTPDGVVRAVDGVAFELAPGEILGLVGESGCGKTITALSVMRLIDRPGRIVEGSIRFDGRDLAGLSADEMAAIRGDEIAMIFQQPKGSLNPVIRVGWQIAEQFRRRRGMDRKNAWREAVAMLATVGIPAPDQKALAYPHELSGGQAQRVMIAIALALQPRLMIADEPTTALDVTVQAQILNLLRERCKDIGTSLILVTHDLGVIAQIADRVAVMYAGQIVEQAPVGALFAHPKHPYTRGLIDSIPRLGTRKPRLVEIPGVIPSMAGTIAGCRFASRCSARVEHKLERCEIEAPSLVAQGAGRAVRCWLAGEYMEADHAGRLV
ncbi:peptide/nickel transport system ATP-binding protein [Rhizobiales bacterium GAS191]|nr:peptide/nickel transport system ATP-binding protein [Rhizobiales bacterium GAS191]